MRIEEIERAVAELVACPISLEFIHRLLLAYGLPKATVTRLKTGTSNLADDPHEVLDKRRVHFRLERHADLHACIESLASRSRAKKVKPRFLITTDGELLLAMDTKSGDSLDVAVSELPKHIDFFLPWAGLEKTQHRSENPADVKAAGKMGQLYDLLRQDNEVSTDDERQALNVFLSRLLFCLFAEDTGIFDPDLFTNAIGSHTREDGSDLQSYLERLFLVLNTRDRADLPRHLESFPYVNGGLFAAASPVPKFTRKSRAMILQAGQLDWKAINPDILGSMIQAVVHESKRDGLGIHYTSVVNILKVLDPLILDELRTALDRAGESRPKLQALLARLRRIRIFDPACGSGNFLIIAYKELCKLEMEVLKRIHGAQLSARFLSGIRTTQVYGIELDDFAHETAKLSLCLAEHQMNVAFREVFGHTRPTLPLQDGGNIVCGNATRIDWEDQCPPEEGVEVFIVGNPPYVGARTQSQAQKADMALVFDQHKDFKDSDYVTCWFLKAARYVGRNSARAAFVATNSIAQGQQVSLLWPRVWESAEIGFAHQAFKWSNSAKGKAGVTCVIVGLRPRGSTERKRLYVAGGVKEVANISPYLTEWEDLVVYPRAEPLSGWPKMVSGSMPRDGGHLLMTAGERQDLIARFPQAAPFLRGFMGTQDFIDSNPRACLWIEDEQLAQAAAIPPIRERIDQVRQMRLRSRAKTTKQYATIPHKLAQRAHRPGSSLLVPATSSEKREYIPSGFLDDRTVISNLAFAIYGAEAYQFAVLSSRMHMVWVRAVAGALEERIRYSSLLCYNTFPCPALSDSDRSDLEAVAFAVLDERERHSERTIAELYDPEGMPEGLRLAHQRVDERVDRLFRRKPFANDADRLKLLFARYTEMVAGEEGHA